MTPVAAVRSRGAPAPARSNPQILERKPAVEPDHALDDGRREMTGAVTNCAHPTSLRNSTGRRTIKFVATPSRLIYQAPATVGLAAAGAVSPLELTANCDGRLIFAANLSFCGLKRGLRRDRTGMAAVRVAPLAGGA